MAVLAACQQLRKRHKLVGLAAPAQRQHPRAIVSTRTPHAFLVRSTLTTKASWCFLPPASLWLGRAPQACPCLGAYILEVVGEAVDNHQSTLPFPHSSLGSGPASASLLIRKHSRPDAFIWRSHSTFYPNLPASTTPRSPSSSQPQPWQRAESQCDRSLLPPRRTKQISIGKTISCCFLPCIPGNSSRLSVSPLSGWRFRVVSMSGGVTYEGALQSSGGAATMFQGKRFWVAHRVPIRSTLVRDITVSNPVTTGHSWDRCLEAHVCDTPEQWRTAGATREECGLSDCRPS